MASFPSAAIGGLGGVKLLIVDDHAVMREGLAALLRQGDTDTCVLQAHDAEAAFDLLEANPDLDVVILDLILPGLGGLSALAEFGRRQPTLPVVVLSSSENPHDVRRALAEGALGYVPKSANPQALLSAIRLVLDGEVYVPPLMLSDPALARVEGFHAQSRPAAASLLTERQVEVLRLLSDGSSNKSIALQLGLSEKTVKVHVTAIFRALNVVNRTQAALVARADGLI